MLRPAPMARLIGLRGFFWRGALGSTGVVSMAIVTTGYFQGRREWKHRVEECEDRGSGVVENGWK